MSHFGALASFTSFDIVLNVSLNPGPPVVACDKFLCFITAGVSSRDTVMVQFDDLLTKLSATWYVNTMFPSNEFAIIVPVLLFVGECFNNSGVLGVIVFLDLSNNIFIKPLNVKTVGTEMFSF